MRYVTRFLTAFVALLAAVPAVAQTTGAAWRPFRVGHTYTFETDGSPKELETVRLAAGRVVGADSVYDFAPFYRAVIGNEVYPPGCQQSSSALFRVERNTPFGAMLLVPTQGAYTLVFTDSAAATYSLPARPLPVGASWAFSAGVTATVTRLAIEPIGTAAVADSVMQATLSTGAQVVLSKSFGLIDAPDLRTLASAAPTNLHLLTIPERVLGGLPGDSPLDWQPGDSVLWYEHGPSICEMGYTLTRYLRRQLSTASDTIYYYGTTQVVRIDWGPGCSSGRRVTVGSPQPFVRARYVGTVRAQVGELLRRLLVSPPPGPGQGYVNQGAYYPRATPAGCFGGWRFRYFAYYASDSCGTLLGAIDFGRLYETVNGFGVMASFGVWGDEGQVVWYRHAGQTCGDRRGFAADLLAAPALLPAAAVQLFPNPATTSARLLLTGLKSGPVALTATDALGRWVWAQTQTIGPEAEVALPVGGWAPGVYYVRVSVGEGTRVVRVVRE